MEYSPVYCHSMFIALQHGHASGLAMIWEKFYSVLDNSNIDSSEAVASLTYKTYPALHASPDPTPPPFIDWLVVYDMKLILVKFLSYLTN